LKRYTDLTPEEQTAATQLYVKLLDPELVEQAPNQANTIAEKRAKRTLYQETTDMVLPLIALHPIT
jgi:hypothetical protein